MADAPEVPATSGGAVLATNRRSKRIGKRKEDLKTGKKRDFVMQILHFEFISLRCQAQNFPQSSKYV